MAAPPTLNLLGELRIMPVLWNAGFSIALTIGVIVFFSAAYNIFLYRTVNHGNVSSYLTSGRELQSAPNLGLLLHGVPLFLLLKGNLF